LELFRTAQEESAVLPNAEYALALTDLVKCYRCLGCVEQATACEEELRRLAHKHP
jgi:hypothetical protein